MELTEQQRNKKLPAHAAYMQRFTLRWACEHPAEPAVVPEFMNRVQAFDGDLLARDPEFAGALLAFQAHAEMKAVERDVVQRCALPAGEPVYRWVMPASM